MKVVFVSTFFGANLGGAEKSIEMIAAGLGKEGVDLNILTTRRANSVRNYYNVRYIPNTAWIPNRMLILGNKLLDLFLADRLKKTMIDLPGKPDILHVQDLYLLPAVLNTNKIFRIPLVFTLRDPIPKFVQEGEYNSLIVKLSSVLFKSRNKVWLNCFKKLNYIITISNFLKTQLEKNGIDKLNITTIYNPADAWYSSEKRNKSFLKNSFIIFAPGRLYKDKGFDVLLKALKLVNNKGIKLLIAGQGPFEKDLKNMAHDLDLQDVVCFLGRVPYKKMKSFYFQSDIVVFPSVYSEPFGRVALEGMIAGKPVIASNVGGIPEIVEHNKTGLLVRPNNVEELAKAINFLITNKEIREKMGEEGRKIANKKFNQQKIINQYINLYNEILKNKIKSVI